MRIMGEDEIMNVQKDGIINIQKDEIREKQDGMMERGRRKVWLCLLAAVLTAVIAGLAFWISTPQPPSTEGYLIREVSRSFVWTGEQAG